MSNYAVIGCGRFGQSVAKTLYSLGHEVLAIDKNMDLVEDIADYVTQAVQADATDEMDMKSLGISNYDVAIVSIASDIQSSIIATILAKELGVAYVICKAKDDLTAKILSKIGADKVVFPERDMGVKLANNLVSKNILEFIELDPKYSIVEVSVSEKWYGKSLQQINFRERYGINVVAIKRGPHVNISPLAEDVIQKDDVLVVVGEIKKMNRLDIFNG